MCPVMGQDTDRGRTGPTDECAACGEPLPGDVWACPGCGAAVLDTTGLPVNNRAHDPRRNRHHHSSRKRNRPRTPASYDRSAHRTLKLHMSPTMAGSLVLAMIALLALAFFLGMMAARG